MKSQVHYLVEKHTKLNQVYSNPSLKLQVLRAKQKSKASTSDDSRNEKCSTADKVSASENKVLLFKILLSNIIAEANCSLENFQQEVEIVKMFYCLLNKEL